MHRFFRLTLVVALALCYCTFAVAGDKDGGGAPANVRVDIWDYCDPVTFAVLGPGACVRDTSTGFITFAGFGTELGLDQSVGAWRFAPDAFRANDGTSLTLVNRGGEVHTFTEVKKFGGGFVAPLNAASGNPDPAPECAQVVNGNLVPQPPSDENIFVLPGATVPGPVIENGKRQYYQCCIHPWMRTIINPKGGGKPEDAHSH